jgi:hypothetical protein
VVDPFKFKILLATLTKQGGTEEAQKQSHATVPLIPIGFDPADFITIGFSPKVFAVHLPEKLAESP